MSSPVRLVASLLVLVLVAQNLTFALGSKNASYIGGTLAALGAPDDPIEGRLNTANETQLTFEPLSDRLRSSKVVIPYAKIVDLEYGQKAGRRVGAAIGTTILLGPIGLLSLFSKKRKHFLTIGFKDEADKDQVAVMELGKDIVRTTLAIVQARSGKTIEFQDDEARKAAK
jgi:hypothetical protein